MQGTIHPGLRDGNIFTKAHDVGPVSCAERRVECHHFPLMDQLLMLVGLSSFRLFWLLALFFKSPVVNMPHFPLLNLESERFEVSDEV